MGFVAPSHTERTIKEVMDKADEDAGSAAEARSVKASKASKPAAQDEVKTTAKASSKATAVKDDKSQDDKQKA